MRILLPGPGLDARHRCQDRSPHPPRNRRRLPFASSAHLAAYAGIAPVTRSSGTSIKGERPARTGNRKLKRAFFLATFAALICLARRRCDVLYAMLRNGTHYRYPEPESVPTAA